MTKTSEANEANSAANIPSKAAHPVLTLLVITGAQLMIVLDVTIVNIALPSMGRYFHKSQTEMTWAINAYALAFGGLLLLGGKAGDILGRRKMFMVGLTLFTAGSLMGGLAQNFPMLIIGRIIQGVGGAISSPAALALIANEFEEGKERTRALAVFAAVAGAGAALGLMLGGILTNYLTWRWVLFVNVPIGITLIFGALVYLRESDRLTGRFDWLGGILSTVGMTTLVFGFIHAAQHGWKDGTTIAAFVVAIALLVGFVALQAKISYGMMPLRIFRDVNRSGAYLVMLIIGAAMFGMFYFLTFFVQGNLHYGPLKAGFAFLPVAFTIGISAQISAKLLPTFGPRRLIVTGSVIMTIGLFWLATLNEYSTYSTKILPAMLVMAYGIGMIFVPLMTVVVSGVEPHDAGLASALLNVSQQVGGSIGLSVLATVAATAARTASRDQAAQLAAQVKSGDVNPDVLQHFAELGRANGSNTVASAAAQADQIANHAISVIGANAAAAGFLAAAIFGVAGIIVGMTMIKTRKEDVPVE